MPGKHPRFPWEKAVCADTGPANPTTRHVLLTIATHVDAGGTAYPSMRRLARETGLSERAVVTHVQIAIGEGYLSVHKSPGRSNFYRLTLPATTERGAAPTTERGAAVGKAMGFAQHTTERGAPTAAPDADTTERPSPTPMNDVQSNMFLSTLKKQKGNSTGAADAASPTPLKEFLQPEQTKKPEQPGRRYETIEEWCARTGMERLPGESDEDMKRRWITRSLTA